MRLMFFSSLLSCTFLLLRSEWATNHHRDSIASHTGHADLLSFFAVAENESIGRTRFNLFEVSSCEAARASVCCFRATPLPFHRVPPLLCSPLLHRHRSHFSSSYIHSTLSLSLSSSQKMLQPCGAPPSKDDDEDE